MTVPSYKDVVEASLDANLKLKFEKLKEVMDSGVFQSTTEATADALIDFASFALLVGVHLKNKSAPAE